MQLVRNEEQKVIELDKDGNIKVPTLSTGEVMMNYLSTVQEGDLMEHAGKLIREGITKIVDGDVEKATVVISLTVSKDKNDAELFVTKGKAQLKIPVSEFSSATFVDKDCAPSRNRNRDNLQHTKQIKK